MNFYQSFTNNNIMRILRIMLGTRKMFYVFLLLILTVLCYLTISYQQITCPTKDLHEKSSENKGISPEELEKLKQDWLEEYKEHEKEEQIVDEPPVLNGDNNKMMLPLECVINGGQAVKCFKEENVDDETGVYMPWTFLKSYYEVYGKMKNYDSYNRFEFNQNYAKEVKKMSSKYNFKGVFMTFEYYNVEVRDRVKCISAMKGVPVSTQWGPKGYFYPIQIAQFGLSHYSKNIVQKPPQITQYGATLSNWKSLGSSTKIQSIKDEVRGSIIHISSREKQLDETSLSIGNTIEHVISLDLRFKGNGSVTVNIDTKDGATKQQYKIIYVTQNLMMGFDKKKNEITYGIGTSQNWMTLTRDLLIDLRKGKSYSKTSKSVKKQSIVITKVAKVVFCGDVMVSNVTFSTYNHMEHFKDAVNWMHSNQDHLSGGWRNMVERKLQGFETLKPGWISAMGQGQAMSLLVRGYHLYKNPSYITSLSKALKPFTLPSNKGGVRAIFMEKYPWYEEYPVTPSLFVLNGFLYSLIGLYDFKTLIEEKFFDNGKIPLAVLENYKKTQGVDLQASYELVSKLYREGITSASKMLPLYDGGSRSFYDLRHFVLGVQPNIARWDYHATHLSQLALIMTISDDPVFKRFYQYWQDYTKGKVADHN